MTVTARKKGSDAEVCVQDDGTGMSEAILASIFTVDKNKRQYGFQDTGYASSVVPFNYSEDCRKKAWQLGQV
jgi:sensor histidine kinase YesM